MLNPVNLEELQADISSCLTNWYELADETILRMRTYLRLLHRDEAYDIDIDDETYSPRRHINYILQAALDELEKRDQWLSQLLDARYRQRLSIRDTATELNFSTSTISRRQPEAITRLSEIVYALEMERREQYAAYVDGYLPAPSYHEELYGIAEKQQDLLNRIINRDKYWIITVSGIGGIGKTALAHESVCKINREFRFERPIWIETTTADEQGDAILPVADLFQALITDLLGDSVPVNSQRIRNIVTQKLRSTPYLIIIDNLESPQNTADLIEEISGLTNPSKFILTTRVRPMSTQVASYPISLTQLSKNDSIHLFESHAQANGIQLSHVTEEERDKLLELTGGNPQAIKLITGLVDIRPAARVWESLQRGQGREVFQLYLDIYMRAWEMLDSRAQAILQSMALVGDRGSTIEHLKSMNAFMTANEFWEAVAALRRRSLIELGRDGEVQKVSIHRLTKTFLHTDII